MVGPDEESRHEPGEESRHEPDEASRHEPGEESRRRLTEEQGGPSLLTDWRDVFFYHLAVDPAGLQPLVPFDLDLRDGLAYVSVVAFDQQRFRTPLLGGVPSPLLRVIGSHPFCNLRTYVRCQGEPGVYFMREWIPNPLSVLVAPYTYGLAQRLARVHYENDRANGLFFGRVTQRSHQLTLTARVDFDAPTVIAPPDSLDAFAQDRYAAFTVSPFGRLRFRIWHPPWPQITASGEIPDADLLRRTGDWFGSARLVGVNYSSGMDGVWIGRPARVR